MTRGDRLDTLRKAGWDQRVPIWLLPPLHRSRLGDGPGDASVITLEELDAAAIAPFPRVTPSAANAADPFRQWTPLEIIAIGLDAGGVLVPRESWAQCHTNYVILDLTLV